MRRCCKTAPLQRCTRSHESDLANDKLALLVVEAVLWHLEVLWCGALANAARSVVVRAVAWAKVPAKVTRVGDGHTAQVSADAQHHKPLGAL